VSSHSHLSPDNSEKLVVKATSDLEHDMIVVSSDILVKKGSSLEETPLEGPFYEEVVDVMPRDMERIDPSSIEYPTRPIPISIVMPSMSLFHSSMNPSTFTVLEHKTYMIDAPNWNRLMSIM